MQKLKYFERILNYYFWLMQRREKKFRRSSVFFINCQALYARTCKWLNYLLWTCIKSFEYSPELFSKKNICWHKSYQLFNIIFSWITFSGKIMSKVYTLDVDGFMVWFCHKLWNQQLKGYATFKNYTRDFVKK